MPKATKAMADSNAMQHPSFSTYSPMGFYVIGGSQSLRRGLTAFLVISTIDSITKSHTLNKIRCGILSISFAYPPRAYAPRTKHLRIEQKLLLEQLSNFLIRQPRQEVFSWLYHLVNQ